MSQFDFVVSGPSEVSALPKNITLLHTDEQGDSLFIATSPSGEWPPALHVGTFGHTLAVMLPTNPCELEMLFGRVRAVVEAHTDSPS